MSSNNELALAISILLIDECNEEELTEKANEFMREHGLDVSGFIHFLEENGFIIHLGNKKSTSTYVIFTDSEPLISIFSRFDKINQYTILYTYPTNQFDTIVPQILQAISGGGK